jgi:hypothetical protein
MTIAIRLSRIIGALALAAALAACSAVKLGYSSLPDLAYWWLDGYLSLNDTQSAQVKEDLRRLHAWHRANELPRVADLLARMEQVAPGRLTAAQACAFVPEFQARYFATGEYAQPALVATASTLGASQLRHLQRKYADNNAKWRKDWIALSPEELKDKRFEQLLERLEMIYGRLDDPQRAVLRAGLERSVFDPERALLERQRRQQDLLQLLRRLGAAPQPAPAEAGALVKGYLERALHSPDPAYRAYQQALTEEGCRIVAAVHESTTAAQREQAVRRLRAYQRDLRELAAANY